MKKPIRIKTLRPLTEFRDGILTSGSTYYFRMQPETCIRRSFSSEEKRALQTPNSKLRNRLAILLTKSRTDEELHRVLVTREALDRTSSRRYVILEY